MGGVLRGVTPSFKGRFLINLPLKGGIKLHAQGGKGATRATVAPCRSGNGGVEDEKKYGFEGLD